jgi:hypothetical protein
MPAFSFTGDERRLQGLFKRAAAISSVSERWRASDMGECVMNSSIVKTLAVLIVAGGANLALTPAQALPGLPLDAGPAPTFEKIGCGPWGCGPGWGGGGYGYGYGYRPYARPWGGYGYGYGRPRPWGWGHHRHYWGGDGWGSGW